MIMESSKLGRPSTHEEGPKHQDHGEQSFGPVSLQ